MRYSVIYSIDCAGDVDPQRYAPPHVDNEMWECWEQTEGDGDYSVPCEVYHLAEADANSPWQPGRGHHQKWCGDLSEEEFAEFLSAVSIYPKGEGSSVGSPGLDFPYQPSRSVVFTGEDEDNAYLYASVTPHCSEKELADWLLENNSSVPVALTDAPTQRYLFKGIADRRKPFKAVLAVMERKYG